MNWNNISVNDECPICLNIYNITENIVQLSCNHATCVKCHIQCNKCPLCRISYNQNIKPPIYEIICKYKYMILDGLENNVNVTPELVKLEELLTYI